LVEKPGLKAKLAVGGLIIGAGALTIYSLFFRPKPTVKVALNSNPIRTVILVDDRIEVVTPKTITLTPGKHKFSAVSKSPNLQITYSFHKWTINGKIVSYQPTDIITITRPSVITANFLVVESGIYPVITT